MTENDLLTMLEYNLEIILDYMDQEGREAKEAELMFYINSAKAFIAREGVTLTDSVEDSQLVVMYASYLYEKRKAPESNYNMPRMLRWALNNRLFSEKVSE